MPDLRDSISTSLQSLATQPLHAASTNLLATLGYSSEKTIDLGDSSPQALLDFIQQNNPESGFNPEKALASDWSSADLLFQLTDEELSPESTLFQETEVKPALLRSYLFFAIQLNGNSATNGSYARGKLTAIARQINRAFPMPVMLLIKHPEQGTEVLSIAVINRRTNKRESHKDVLEKATIIRDISLTEPHRGHLDILNSFALENLVHPEKKAIHDFDTLHAAWEEIFNIELLNKRFYKELANWYFWALPQVDFPTDLEPEDEKRRATGLIRLLTRLIFCWFIKEKGLVPEKLFHATDLKDILVDFDSSSDTDSNYYHAILQNLFFATLNQRMGRPKTKNAVPFRRFVTDKDYQGKNKEHGITNLYRYPNLFNGEQETALSHFEDIPFLNGGLFECLDKEDASNKNLMVRIDGFTTNGTRPTIPNHLFFSDEISGIDLSETYGERSRRKEKVSGLIRILNRYKFTIVENTPIDQEIALDPELLGKVFENLLASYNEETKTTARKQTGSFYTPRPIVDYMVDESLKAHLAQALTDKTPMTRADAEAGLDILFAYTEKEHAFSDSEIEVLLESVYQCKILDPACGSGAYPMGVLHKLVFILTKLDPQNEKWEKLQLKEAEKITNPDDRRQKIATIMSDFSDNYDDYGRKLYLIESCLYGVDIQPIAIQISKLRFFISLICDQKTNRSKKDNHGIRPLPNLETKFVAANTLIGLPFSSEELFVDTLIEPIERKLSSAYHDHFSADNRRDKLKLQQRIKKLRIELGETLQGALGAQDADKAHKISQWDPFDPQSSADFFDPHWMFGQVVHEGFDIVIGNPPYVQIQKFPAKQKEIWTRQGFKTYAATADIYCLFYERGAQLLKQGGSLVYITSNKWMRAGYGKGLRKFLSSEVDTESVLDFGMAQNFGAATTYTCITRFYNQQPDDRILSCYATDDRAAMEDPAAYFAANAVVQPNLSEDAWVVLSKERQEIKSLVEAQGVPLEDWDLQIYRGVLTGFNEAFYLTQEQRDALIAEDPASTDLIVPLLRGRYIERYGTSWAGEYMINSHNGIRSKGIKPVDVKNNYPAIWSHLGRWQDKLEKRQDQGEHWSNLRNCAYTEAFLKPKIILQEIAVSLPFLFDPSSFFMDTTCFMLNSNTEQLEYLTAVLNSSIFRCSFRSNFPEYSGNACRVKKIFVDKIPIKKPTPEQASLFSALVPLIQFAKADGQHSAYAFLEDLIDACVMECYFRDHMAERDLLFLDQLAPSLASYTPDAPESAQRDFLESFLTTHNAPTAKIRNQLLRLTADSPEFLAVIKKEGQV